jgi:enediyne polyketide synthase
VPVSQGRLVRLEADDLEALAQRVSELRDRNASGAGLADVEYEPAAASEHRAALVAATPQELEKRIDAIEGWLTAGTGPRLRVGSGAALASAGPPPKIGFVFPGQGAPLTSDGGYLEEVLPEAAAAYRRTADLSGGEVRDELVQLSVVVGSVAGLGAMEQLGIEADFGLGHSVGELTALHWAGVLDTEAALELARRRGEVMTEHASGEGGMASIEATDAIFTRIMGDADVTVACFNSPLVKVVSGPKAAVEAVVERARAADGARALPLPVVGAFHSPLMNEPAVAFEPVLAEQPFAPLQRPVFSTVSGKRIGPDDDVADLLRRQMTEPVLFVDAVEAAIDGTDLLIEVGPGQMLSRLMSEFVEVPAIPLRVGQASPEGLLTAAGAAWALGVDVDFDRLRGA